MTGADSTRLQSKRISYSNIKVSEARLEDYLPQKHVQTPSEIQLTAFQQRQGILPDSSISTDCHVFMYLSPIDNRLTDIKSFPQFQALYSFLSHLDPALFSNKVTLCNSLKIYHVCFIDLTPNLPRSTRQCYTTSAKFPPFSHWKCNSLLLCCFAGLFSVSDAAQEEKTQS